MTESVQGWSEFQSALSQLQSVAGGGGGGGGAGGGGGGATNFVPTGKDYGGGGYGAPVAAPPGMGSLDMGGFAVGIDVGEGSGVTTAQRDVLISRGFRGSPGDSSERLYGSGDTDEFKGFPRSAIHPIGSEPFPAGGFQSTY